MRVFIKVDFMYPNGYTRESDTIASFEPDCRYPEKRGLPISHFCSEFEDRYGFRLVTAIPVRVDPIGPSRIDLLFAATDDVDIDAK